jgi:PAS domain S-box-containing protein
LFLERLMIGNDELIQRINAMDWSATPLGHRSAWPQALSTLVELIFSSSQPMHLVWGPQRTFIYNAAFAPILAKKHPAAMGCDFLDIWSEIRQEISPYVEQAYAGEPVLLEDMPLLIERNGHPEQTHFTFSYTPMRGLDNQVAGYFCACIETTRQVMLDHQEQRDKSRLTTALRVAKLGCFEWQPSSGHMTLDSRAREIFGLPYEGTIHETDIFALIAAGDSQRVRAESLAAIHRDIYFAENQQNQVDLHCEIITPNGSTYSIESTGIVTTGADGTRQIIGSVSDVTDMKKAQSWLREKNMILEQRLAERTADRNALWQLSSDIMLRCTFETIVVAVNPAWNTLLGWAEHELLGSSLLDLIHPDDLAHSIASAGQLSQGLDLARVENRYRHRDGSYRWISWSTRSADGLINAVGRDITEDKAKAEVLVRTEEALRQSQKMEAIGQLTGGVAHDFNNLLTVIKSSSDLLKRPDLPADRRSRYVKAISDTVDRAAKVTSQLLAFARRQALTPEVFAACDSVRSLASMIGTLVGSQIEVVLDMPEDTNFVKADLNQFDTALVNMALNARDAMKGQGKLSIRVCSVEQLPTVRMHPAIVGDYVAVTLTDTGSGIAPEQIDQIFEPFFTTKDVGQGTGLGLSQVFGFAKQSGGEITVVSELGKGSTFTLYLPKAPKPAEKQPEEEPEALINGHGTGVLVVEDNLDVGTFAVQSLSDLGYKPVLANNAQEALDELAKDASRFDVVFSDVVMPGMNGIELGHEIRRLYHDLPVLLASGYSHVLAKNGTYGFELLHKPYSVEQLSRLLRKVAVWQRRQRILDKR